MIRKIPTLIFGAAGASKDIYYWVKAANRVTKEEFYDVVGIIDSNQALAGKVAFDGIRVIGKDEDVPEIVRDMDMVALIVPFGDPHLRKKVVDRLKGLKNAFFPSIIHPSVVYDPEAGIMGSGNHIGPGVIFGSEYELGDHNYINTGAHFGHDIKMGNFNSINPSASCAGNVTIGNFDVLSINAAIIEETSIVDDVIIGGNAIVTDDITESGTYVGVPVRKIK